MQKLSIPVFRGLILLVVADSKISEVIEILSIPVFRGLILLVHVSVSVVFVAVSSFNPRFQGTHFVRIRIHAFAIKALILSIPVFRGLILLGPMKNLKNSENISFSVLFR